MSLYDKYGGYDTVEKIVVSFYDKVKSDDRIKDFFQETDFDKQIKHQTAFISEALGGPKVYKGLDMRKAHAKFNLNEEHFNAVGENLKLTLEEFGVDNSDIDTIMNTVVSLKDDVLNK